MNIIIIIHHSTAKCLQKHWRC